MFPAHSCIRDRAWLFLEKISLPNIADQKAEMGAC
jgi:hypothetical protein